MNLTKGRMTKDYFLFDIFCLISKYFAYMLARQSTFHQDHRIEPESHIPC